MRASSPDPASQPGASATLSELASSVFDVWDAHVAVVDGRGQILTVNAAWRRFAAENDGDAATTGIGANYFEVCEAAVDTEPVAEAVLQGLHMVRAGTLPEFALDYSCHGPEEERWYRFRARALDRGRGAASRLLVIHENVSDRKRIQNDVLARSKVLDEVDAAVIGTDLDGIVTLWNRGAERIHGWSADEALGFPLHRLTIPVDSLEEMREFGRVLFATGRWEGELRASRRDGSTFPAYARYSVVVDEDGERTGIVGVSADLSARLAIQGQLNASTRELQAITNSIGEGLCTLDSDGLISYVNPQGQRLLRASSSEARGGSFLHWLHSPDGSQPHLALSQAEMVIRPVTCRLMRKDGSDIPIEYVATPLLTADESGPSGWVVVFRDITNRVAREEEMAQRIEQSKWVERITMALADDGFVLYAQPIIEVGSGAVVQYELLIRMRDTEDPETLISPALFLPMAEALGLAPQIDRWVLERGLQIAASGMSVQINLSARSLDDPALPSYIEQLLHRTGADPSLVGFEITETALLENDATASRFVDRVHALGCHLALDDFGTGYGGFTYLKRLPVDYLKIDIEFVRDAVTNPASRHVIDAVVSLAQAFGMRTIAEGVEDAETLALLGDLQVDLAQGYHLGRPGPLPETVSLARPGGKQ